MEWSHAPAIHEPDYRRFVIAAIGASLGIMVGSAGQWVGAGMFGLNGLDAGKVGIAALTIGAVSCLAMVLELFWQRTPFSPRWALPVAWAAAVAGVTCVSYFVPFVIIIMDLPKANFFGVPMGAEVGWGLWLLVLSAAALCATAAIIATRLARSIANPSWTNGWRWTAIVTSAAVTIASLIYWSVNWNGNAFGGSDATPTAMPSFPSVPSLTFPSFPSFSTNPEEPTTSTTSEEPTTSRSTTSEEPSPSASTLSTPPEPSAESDFDRIANPAGGFSYVRPAGWVESDATHLDYGSALLSKETGAGAPGEPPDVANDTRILLGRLDQKLYASAEADNTKAATRLASDMGEFFMPYPGTGINQATEPLNAPRMAGGAWCYEVKFVDTTKPNGQICTAVIGLSGPKAPPASANQRWFVIWLGTANDPVDGNGATALAESIRPWPSGH